MAIANMKTVQENLVTSQLKKHLLCVNMLISANTRSVKNGGFKCQITSCPGAVNHGVVAVGLATSP